MTTDTNQSGEVKRNSLNKSDEDVKLDEILEALWQYIAHDRLDIGIRPDEAKQALLDWHNKQVEEVLDRLESQSRRADDCTDDTLVVKMIWVVVERNKLKESR